MMLAPFENILPSGLDRIVRVKHCPICYHPRSELSGISACCGILFIEHYAIPFAPRWGKLMMLLLSRGDFVSTSDIVSHIYNSDNETETSRDNLEVTILYMRNRLKGTGLTIENRYKWGYRIRRCNPTSDERWTKDIDLEAMRQ